MFEESLKWKTTANRKIKNMLPGAGFLSFTVYTLPETKISPESRLSPKEIHLPTIDFQGWTVSFRKGIAFPYISSHHDLDKWKLICFQARINRQGIGFSETFRNKVLDILHWKHRFQRISSVWPRKLAPANILLAFFWCTAPPPKKKKTLYYFSS